ncbi:MAG: HYR domain-containing protein [Flavobacteriales bacterium]|nr:HYR domain-containing protein [Flavobacteriales bacterium]
MSFTCANTGANTVTLTATDPSGNTDQCTSIVTVQDNVDPTAICQNITVQLNGAGTATITAAQVDNGSNDNCSVTLSATPLSFTCANTGANTVTLTATDPSGNTDQCTSTVTVQDNVDPTAICQNITVQLNGAGTATITAAQVNNGSNDNCAVTLSATPLSFTCANTGANTVTLTATDPSGNTDQCTATVTVQDNVDPTAICQNITVQLNGAGTATITAAQVDNGSNDNCSVTLSATPLSFTCVNTGANTVTLTATDPSGNTDQCAATVTVQDNVDPTAICQNITVQLNGAGTATITAAQVDNGSNDNCSVTLSATPLSFTCANTGANTVTLTATDPSGNTDQCTSTVTVQDNVDPTAICQNITVQLNGAGTATITAAQVNNGSNDNCSVTLSATPLSFTCANTGANTVTLTATDPSGNSATCTSTVTIQDNVDPTAICQNITVQLNGAGTATITAAQVDNGSNDNCSVVLSATPLTFNCSNTGANTVTLTATDPSGNTDQCTSTVTIQDNVDPTAICQNITVQLNGAGTATITAAQVDNGSNDNCSVTLSATPLSFTCANTGANTVTLTATDPSGNTDQCTSTVTVQDNVDPTAICQNITVQLNGAGTATITAAQVDNGSNDNCSVTLSATPLSFTCANTGANTVTLTATDPSGNSATCTSTVTVQDNVNPTAICQNITVQLDANGDLTILAADIDGGSTDNCGPVTFTIDGGNTSQDFDCSQVGANTVTLTVTDASGNVATCNATVTIEDNVDPTAVCQNITVQLDGTGNLSITSANINNGSSDACGVASLTINGGNLSQGFDCSTVGTNTVTLTVTDVNGNISTCDATVTVEDNVDPTAVCQNITIQLDATGNATIVAADIDNGSSDNCGIASLVASATSFTCADEGANTVTLTVTDDNGNVSTCDATVTVENNVSPNVFCQDITVYLDATGNVSILADDVNGGSNASCGLASLTVTPDAFTCANVGANTVTLTAVDNSGNISTCVATVTVLDTISPTAICQNITVQLDANGDLTITSSQIDNGSSDACGIASLTIDGGNTTQDFDCSNVGANTVTLTVTDVNGNVSTCDATVTIEDTVDPTAICQNITAQLDANGDLTITSSQIDNGSSDACGIASLTIDGGNTTQDFDCSNVGANTVTLTVTDVNGNVSTCTATVTVEDNVDPTAICQNITVQLDANGDLTITSSQIDNGSSDACGIASLTIDGGNTTQDFDCSNVGANTVTLTVTDVNGNVSTCNATVTVEDNVDPTAVCQNITIQLDANGDLTITSSQIDNGSSDACGIASLTIDGGNTTQDFDCSNVGANTVTLTVTDVNGNVSTCNATVTIEDNVDPTAICQNITVQLDANGDLTITSSQINNGSLDACGIASLTIDGGNTTQDFDCSNVGANTVMLTVTDVNGNVSTCNATVTVEDNVDPTAICQNITVQLDANGELTLLSTNIDGGSTDNCGVASVTIDGGNTSQDFDCTSVGTQTITLTVTDVNGNVSTCNATITIEDNVDPTALCQNITVQLDANGDLTITSAQIDNGSSDACGIASLTIDGGNTSQDFDCSNVGLNTVTLTVTDVNGNVSTCNATVTIEDTVDPTAICQNITVQLDANGDATVLATTIDNGSTDNCGIASITLNGNASSHDFDCSNVGVNTVTLTVTDVNGNVSTCSADITIEDNVDPTALCQNISVQLDATGNATITGSDIDNGSADNCGVASLDVSVGAFDCSNIGLNTVTLTVTDNNGNVSTCTADVTIEDNVDPTALCQNITVQLDANGDATIVASDVDGGSTDNCGVGSIAVNVSTFDCSDIGNNLVVLTVTDVNGNTSTCTASVTIEDMVPPIPVCIDIIAELSPAGTVTVAPGDVDNGSTDNCAIASITLNPNSFTCAEVGFNTVTLTVTDASGNVSTCTAQVDVQDNVLPSAICQSLTVQLDASGNATITPNMVDNGSTDACGAVTPTIVTPSTFDCSNVGVNIVTLTVEDQNGNISTCASTVTIQDIVPPVAVCQNITVQLNGTGNASIVPADVDGGSSDNCAIDLMTVSPNTFTCAEEGPNTVTLTVTDVNGNVSTCTAVVTVENNIIPSVSCQDITVYLDGSGNASIVATDVDGGSNAACGIASLTVNPSAFTCANVGTNTVTLTGTDNSGNVSTCTAVVTVLDTISPTAVCQNVVIQLNAAGNASVTAASVNDGSADNCAIASLTLSQTSFACAEVGANTVTLTVTDANGNTSTCTSSVTVEDNIDPTIVCQNITVELDASGNVSITGADIDNGTTDNCSTVGSTLTLDVTPGAFDCNNVGSNTVTLTATDENGNSSSCTADVTVEDNEAPIALCQNITIYLDATGNVGIVPADVDNGSSDNCGIANMIVTPNSFTCSGVGPNPVTLTVTDVNGNVASCASTVTVLDTISPNAICQDIVVQVDASGNASIVPSQVNNGSNDACGITSLVVDVSTFNCSVVGANTVTLTVADDNGNTSTCTSNVTVEDNVDPNALCQGVTVQLDANGDASIVASQINNNSTDNCAIASLAVSTDAFDCSNVGANTVTLTVTDVNGNTDNCTATVTVQDNIDPTAVCQNITVQLDANGDLTITSANIDGGSSDNCGIASLTIDGGNTNQAFDCSNVGANTVTLTVTDVNGNVSTCDATVTVEDNINPTAVCQNITVQLDANGDLTITSADIDGGSTDACGIASLTIDGGNATQDFDCSNVGANTVTLTVTDVSGNVSTCDATVTVEDNVDPTAVCQNITVQLDANGDLTITSADIDGGSTDNCGIASLEIDGGNTTQEFDCSNVGANTVTLTVTDVNGNVSTCDATVTVEDNIDPTAVCQNITVQLDANGDLTIASADIDGGSSDNCGIASLEIDGGNTTQAFDCSNVGANTVTLTVTDVNGNVSTCDATVTVEDNVDPTAVCQNITVQLDANGNATINSIDIDGGSTDNCGIASYTVDGGNTTFDFDCADEGTNTITLTITDVNGNVSTCDATVTIENNVAPNVFCQDITVYLDATGNISIIADDVNGGSNASCGLASLTVSQDAFDCSNVGPNTVTLTAIDNSGNTSTCDAIVTVLDTISPTAVCQNITVQLDANGELTIASADIDGGSADNCGVASLEIDGGNTTQDFECSNVGANTVTLTVTDVNGNVSTCDATVTVEDNIDPTAVCQNITVQLDANGDLTIMSADIDNGSTDACGIASLTIDGGNANQAFDCSTVGTNTVTLTVTDVNGNASTCDAIVTVEDTISPTAVCQNITVQLDANGELTITSADINGGSNDNCGIASLEIDNGNTTQDFDCSQVGTNTVTLTVTDVNGNVSTCDATVTVEDNVDPNAVCQNITVLLDANGDLTITSADIDNGSFDNCGIASLEIDGGNTTQAFDCSNVGANTVTLTVTDVNGNVSTCDAIVTVEDTISPTIICQDITIELDPSGTVVLTAVELDGGTTDNCGSVTLSIDAADTQWTCADVGTQTITLTATDANGNVSTCDAQLTIENNEVPTVSCQDITVYLNATGNVSIAAGDVNGGSNASCGLASLSVSPNAFDCSNVGANTVTLTATDNTGNVSTCTATVAVLDTISPTAVCNDITVDLDVNGDIIIVAADLDGGSADNCGIATVTVDSGQLNTTLDCSTVGDNIITVTVTDVNGNVSTCDATITVEDNTNPTAACASVTVQLDANGEAVITPVLVDNGSSDNCGIATMSVLPQMLNCNNVGANSIILTVTDVNGNISTCIATVTAQDTVPPTAVCTDITVQLTSNGTAIIAAGDIDDGSFDNCGIQSLAIDVNSFDCSEIGGNTVELTVTDVNGNTSTCTANANVVDEVDPNVICQNLSVYLEANGQVTITADDIDNGSTDACGIDTMTLSVYTFDCTDIGVNPVTLTVTDNYGNFDICQAVVRVFDTIPPVTVCQDITIQLDATGTASIVAADVDGGSTDNCGIDAISVDQTIFDCSQVGDNTVVLTVIDVNGNESTCEAIVTVEDNVNPNANCQDITIQLDAAGNASISASDINAGSDANCGIDTVFVSQMNFDCSNVGNNIVTLTVVDVNGNQSTCTSSVEVLDTISPTAICQDLITQLNAAGEASITVLQVNNGSFDNCGILSLVLDDRTFDCSDAGVNQVVLTVTDINGNVSTCTSQVTVQDNVSPHATCTPVVVQMDANGVATITADEVDLNSSDNCAIDTMLLSQYTFDCSEIGTNSVTLTVIDASGNSSTCDAVIIVEENVPPVALCQNMTVYLDVLGDATILASDVDAGSTDNCAIDTMYVTPNDFSCSGVGVNPVVLTVIDVNGNVSSCNASVTVVDTISPVAICQDIVVQVNADGETTIDAEEVDNGSSDACGITGFVVDLSNFDCSNVGANTVVLTVEDNNGNTSTCTATVTIEDNINPIANCTDLTVILDGNGMVSILANELNDNSTDNCAIDTIFASQIDFSCADLGSNIITVTVVDVNGNSANCSSELTVLDTISPVIIACPMDTVIVPDSSDCSPQVFWTEPTAADNCTPTLTSNFVPGDNFPVGTTTVTYTATDESNNSVSCSFDVTIEPSPVLVEITSPEGPCGYNLSCGAVPNGEATANPSGGCLPYTYVWTNGQTTQTATGLGAGLHGVTVTDANGTSAVQTIILTEPDPLTTDSITSPEFAGGANISCIGEFDGAISINVLGGEECVTYNYAWTGPNGFTSTTEDISGLEAGTYIVVVSDASGCSYTDSITLTEPAPFDVDSLVSDYNGVNISCGGAADGSIGLTISGGAAPYSVSWSNGDTTEDIDSLMAGIYTYTVTDANGCEISGSITLTEPDGLSSFITTSDYNGFQISCNGLADGSIDLTVNEGTQPYSYSWNNGETTEDLANLEAGIYFVNITDANGCTLIDSVTLTQPDSLIVFSVDTNLVSCNGAMDGSFFVQANGGIPTYTFSWSDGQMGPTAEEIGLGFYTVTVLDQNGCQDSLQLEMTEPDVLDASLVQIYDVICFGESNGIIDVNVIGGTTPYSYNWSNNDTLQDLNGVAAGTYLLEVTDANGCTDTLSATISEPTELIMSVDTVINSTCSGAMNGEITVEATGGTAPYTYTWPNLNISGPTASGLNAGVYEVHVVDANNCSWSMNVAVGQPTSIQVQVQVQSSVSCNGLADGSAVVTVSGGTTPYTYLWSNSDTDSLATGFGAGVHTVTVTDAGGCDTTLTFLIDEPALLTIALDTLFNVTCNGAANGQIEVDVTGGTTPYTATWSNGDAGFAAYNLAAGTYTVYVTDGHGCTDSLSATFTEPEAISVHSISTVNVLCKGGNNGEATIIAEGGTAPLTYNWPSIGQTGNTATTLEAGTYTFVVTDASGCTYSDIVQITQPDAIVVSTTSDTAVCPGSGVTISASAIGGAGNFSYTWNNGLGLGASHFVSPTVATTYTVLVVDENGCAASLDSVTVNMASTPVAAFSSSASAPCVLPSDIQFTNMSSGATGYQWILGNGTQSSDVNPTATYANAGTYTVTLIAISGAGCADTTTGTVIIDNIPTAAFTLNNAQGCAPLVVNFGNNSTTGLDYLWDFGDGTTSTISHPIHVYDIPGEYEVTLIVSSLGGCSDTLSLGAAVSAYPSPIADFTANNTSFPDPGNEYEFVNNSVDADLYNWDFGNDDQSDEFQPTYEFPSYGGYFVTLTAINEFGCADTAVHYISVELQTTLYVPNAMGIGEVGEASIFLPKGTGIADYHLWIFDKWGNLLWESTALNNGSPAEGWDGVYKGAVVPMGSYVWKINATFVDGEIWDGQDFTNGKHGNSGTVMVLY